MPSRILVVDDEPATGELCRDFLEVGGYAVSVDNGGRAALQRLAGESFDLVLTDLSMPVMDGLALLKEVKRLYPLTEVIVMTAYGSIASAVEAMKSGAYDYITKPFTGELIAATVKRCLETQALKRRLGQTQDELLKKEKLAAIGSMASGVAHRMRNPLGIILMCVQYLGGKLESHQEYSQILSAIEDKAKTLEKLTRDFIEYSHASQIRRVPSSLAPLIDGVLKAAAARCRIQGVEVVSRVPAPLPLLSLDVDLIREALTNIVDNALDAMKAPGGRITLEVGANGAPDPIQVVISNTGPCPDPETLTKIFDPFFTTKETGIGLGLTIARQVVEGHEGKIWVQADPSSRATSVFIQLPVTEP
jgi:signal transduction histidine kinase